ncbi:MAG TPA: hypothetical protein VL495_03155 [Edaphobacter sp.]|nr:hypothetical protein [Edaphobacter sp.]
MRRSWRTGMWIFLALGTALPALGQRQSQTGTMPPIQQGPPTRNPFPSAPGMSPMGSGDPMGTSDVLNHRMAEQQARARNNDRQKRIESDTDKLLGLANELKQQVQGEKQLSPEDVSKRAEEIEKLARSVKDRMKG